MSGSITAISAFNGTGTQGFATTDKYTEGVRSVFWNDNDTVVHFVNGSCVSEITSNITETTTVFTVENDIDAINDFLLYVESDNLVLSDVAAPDPSDEAKLPIYFMANFIDRIEIVVSNQIISTISSTLIKKYFLDSTIRHIYHNDTPVVSGSGRGIKLGRKSILNSDSGTLQETDGTWSTTFPLPIFSLLTPDVNSAFLMACANNQTFQIKVYPRNLTVKEFGDSFHDPSNDANALFTGQGNLIVKFRLFANRVSMSNAERSYLRRNSLPKRTFITQTSDRIRTGDADKISEIVIDCNHFNLYTSAIYILADASYAKKWPAFDIELKLNSTTYSGVLPSKINVDQLDNTELWCFKFELGNSMKPIISRNTGSVTDQNFVPLNRFDSIQIHLTPIRNYTTSSENDPVIDRSDLGPLFLSSLCAVAIGKTTARYQKGSVTFNNF